MRTRILTSAVGIPAVLALLFWPGGWPWFCFTAALMAMAIYEFTKGLSAKGIYVHWIALGLLGAAMMANALADAHAMPGFGVIGRACTPQFAVFVAMLLLAGDMLWSRRSPLKNIGATAVGFGWLGLTLPFLVRIRGLDAAALSHRPLQVMVAPPLGAEVGAWLMFAVILVIWAGDSGAYFIGKAFGVHKMAPAISPNKTWEGAAGGLGASWAVGALMTSLIGFPPAICLLFGLVVGVAGQIGDLVESAIKREIGIKDFGDLLPGHGGVLDRFDSLLFAAPVAFVVLYPEGLLRFLR